ncbi:hypothetical protein V6N13_124409 [Hibiscus sabdariffa]
MSQVIPLFVQNVPPSLHWKGLFHMFGKHGEVIDTFIARKLDKIGNFSVSLDSVQVGCLKSKIWWVPLERRMIHKENLGSSLQDSLEDRRDREMQWGKPNLSGIHGAKISYYDVLLNKSGPVLKRVKGFVEDESLKKLSKCLIGTMLSLKNASEINILISTNKMEGICDSIILEVENECFMIHVVDRGLVDHVCSPKNVSAWKSNPTLSEFMSESSSESC